MAQWLRTGAHCNYCSDAVMSRAHGTHLALGFSGALFRVLLVALVCETQPCNEVGTLCKLFQYPA